MLPSVQRPLVELVEANFAERERERALDFDEFSAKTGLDELWTLNHFLFYSVTAVMCCIWILTGHHENDKNESPSGRLQWGCCGGLN